MTILCIIKLFLIILNKDYKCRGRDSNPRRPTPTGPEPVPFDRSGTPAFETLFKKDIISILFKYILIQVFYRLIKIIIYIFLFIIYIF
jgi:hypothetical protein